MGRVCRHYPAKQSVHGEGASWPVFRLSSTLSRASIHGLYCGWGGMHDRAIAVQLAPTACARVPGTTRSRFDVRATLPSGLQPHFLYLLSCAGLRLSSIFTLSTPRPASVGQRARPTTISRSVLTASATPTGVRRALPSIARMDGPTARNMVDCGPVWV